MSVYNITPGQPFAKILAQHVLDKTQNAPESLSDIRILLPTRRACRVLRESFLSLSEGRALLLPRLQPIGDIDEEELALSSPYGDLALELPPAIAPLKRQILLAKLIEKLPDFGQSFAQSLELAKALGHFMDQIYTENLDMADLANLVPESFAQHWNITLKFLEILSVAWPEILREQGVIDTADRRNRLILALNEHWKNAPPNFPVIASGTTGSIPATAALLKTIAALPQGEIILPGLDPHMDVESWGAMDETHPQFGFRGLLKSMDLNPQAVPTLGAAEETPRQRLTRETMRPGETTQIWANLDAPTITALKSALESVELYTCAHEQEEADTIALLMRETLETPLQTACLITPDRGLAQRVRAALKRWNISVDDSAGQPLSAAPLGTFLSLILHICESDIAPVETLSLLKHGFVQAPETAALDVSLRGAKPAAGFDGLRGHISAAERISDQIKTTATAALVPLEAHLKPILSIYNKREKIDFTVLLKTHLHVAETLCAHKNLWQGETGQAASKFFAELLSQSHNIAPIHPLDYASTLNSLMANVTIRPAYGTHPRLQILGQLEARLIDADRVILGGLNEGTWPPDPAADPWMSRPMRKDFGLPSPERGIGLAAHDFTQGLCAPNVILTRAEKHDGAPSVPARWLQRLGAVLQAAGISENSLSTYKALHWSEKLNEASEFKPLERPAPMPPVAARPDYLSVTKIEKWLQDPYSLYADSILKLRKLDDLEKPIDAAIKGTLLHNILHDFITAHPKDMPQNAAEILQDTAAKYLEDRHEDPALWALWQARFKRTSQFYAEYEREWRQTAKPLKTEIKGTLKFGNFTLSARADRIDRNNDTSATIIDYKSGGTYTKGTLANGEYPQMPLEALILEGGGFDDTPAIKTTNLQYWMLNGGGEGGKITIAENIEEMLQQIRQNFETLIEVFAQKNTPYLSLPRPDKAPRFNDYLHLARVQEWSSLSDDTDAEAA